MDHRSEGIQRVPLHGDLFLPAGTESTAHKSRHGPVHRPRDAVSRGERWPALLRPQPATLPQFTLLRRVRQRRPQAVRGDGGGQLRMPLAFHRYII